jgi:hypothetical protein
MPPGFRRPVVSAGCPEDVCFNRLAVLQAAGTTWTTQTPTSAPGAVAVVQLCSGSGAELESSLTRLGIAAVPVGGVALRDLCGVDRGIAARWAETSIHLMPHGGPAVLRLLARKLAEAGIASHPPSPRETYPEASSLLEARMLQA